MPVIYNNQPENNESSSSGEKEDVKDNLLSWKNLPTAYFLTLFSLNGWALDSDSSSYIFFFFSSSNIQSSMITINLLFIQILCEITFLQKKSFFSSSDARAERESIYVLTDLLSYMFVDRRRWGEMGRERNEISLLID